MYLQKNKNLIFIPLFTFLFTITISCNNHSSAQKLLIEEEKLVEVLCDIQIAEAMLDTEAAEVRDSILKVYYPQIMEKHHVQRIDFDSTIIRLGRQPLVSSRIFEKVQKKLKELSK